MSQIIQVPALQLIQAIPVSTPVSEIFFPVSSTFQGPILFELLNINGNDATTRRVLCQYTDANGADQTGVYTFTEMGGSLASVTRPASTDLFLNETNTTLASTGLSGVLTLNNGPVDANAFAQMAYKSTDGFYIPYGAFFAHYLPATVYGVRFKMSAGNISQGAIVQYLLRS